MALSPAFPFELSAYAALTPNANTEQRMAVTTARRRVTIVLAGAGFSSPYPGLYPEYPSTPGICAVASIPASFPRSKPYSPIVVVGLHCHTAPTGM